MRIFFLFLAALTLTLLCIAFYLGLHSDINKAPTIFNDSPSTTLTHFYFGLIATVSALITHTWVFFYFIGTGEGIREGVLENNLDASAIKLTKKFKGMTFPFALFSMLFLITTSILGSAFRFGHIGQNTHLGFAIFSILFNLFSFFQEYRVIRRNETLMRELNEKSQSLPPATQQN